MKSNTKRILLLVGLIGVVAFGFGFFVGNSPDERLVRWGIRPPPLRLLVENRSLLPEELIPLLRKKLHSRIEVEYFENKESLQSMSPYFDLFLGSTCLIESLQMDSIDLSNRDLIKKSISPDFLRIVLRESSVLPLFWKVTLDKKFQVYSLRVKRQNSREKQIISSLENFLEKDFIMLWTESTGLSTSLMNLDESSLEPELKSSAIRSLKLSELKLLDHSACK